MSSRAAAAGPGVRPLARLAPILLLLSLGPAGPALAAPTCRGTIAGSVRASFACAAEVTTDAEGRTFFAISPTGPIAGVPACAPGAFELPGGARAGSYSLDTLGMGKASVAAEGGTLYTAAKTTGQRGEVRLTLTRVRPGPAGRGVVVHGSYRARLLPAGAGKTGEVIVEARF